MVIHNGEFITLNEEQPFASSLAVKERKIFKVGPFDEIKPHIGKNTEIIDLKGKTVIPGFIDTHIHLISLGLDMQIIDLREITSKSILLSRIENITKQTPSTYWIKGYGFDETILDELPNKMELDSITSENPVYLEDITSRICIVNSLALPRVNLQNDIKDVIIERNGHSGDFTGIIRVVDENLLNMVAVVPTLDPVDNTLTESELESAIEIASKKVMEEGITSIHDPQLPPNALRAFKNVVRDGRTPLRMYLGCDKNRNIELKHYISEGIGSEPFLSRLKMGLVKLFADGRISIQEFKERVKEAHIAGLQLSIHATNIVEINHALGAIEEVLEELPRTDHRHRLEHADIVNEEILETARKLGVLISAQPELVYKLEPNYPDDFMRAAYNSMIKSEIIVAGGSDSPTVPIKRRARPPLAFPTPLLGMAFLVTRKTKNGQVIDKDERISVLESLKIYTINGAHLSFEESIKGSLHEGKLADLVVLSENPFKIDPEGIANIDVEMTIIDGKVVFSKNNILRARKTNTK